MVSLSDDGRFTVLMGDILSVVQLKLPVKVIVFNNGALGIVAREQKFSGFLNTGTELQNRIFVAMAEAIGCPRDPTRRAGAVDEGIHASSAHNGLVDAVVNRTDLVMPPSITMEVAKGFTLFMVNG